VVSPLRHEKAEEARDRQSPIGPNHPCQKRQPALDAGQPILIRRDFFGRLSSLLIRDAISGSPCVICLRVHQGHPVLTSRHDARGRLTRWGKDSLGSLGRGIASSVVTIASTLDKNLAPRAAMRSATAAIRGE